MNHSLQQISAPRIILTTTLIVLMAAAGWLLLRFNLVLIMLVIAIVISLAVEPAARRLTRLGLPEAPAVGLVFATLLLVLLFFVWRAAPVLSNQATFIGEQISEGYESLRLHLFTSNNLLLRRISAELPAVAAPAATPSPESAAEMEDTVAAISQGVVLFEAAVRAVFLTLGTFLLAFYWTLESGRIKRALYIWWPGGQRAAAREVGEQIEMMIRRYTVGQGVLSVAIGILSFVAYLIIGVPYAFALALVAGLFEIVPYFGPALGAIPAIIVAYTVSPGMAVQVILATIIIQQIENVILVPRVMARTVGVHPIVTLIAFLALGSLFGVAGLLVAVPIAAAVSLLLTRTILSPQAAPGDQLEGRGETSRLRYEARDLIGDIRRQLRQKMDGTDLAEDQVEDSLEAIARDLESLLAQRGSTESAP